MDTDKINQYLGYIKGAVANIEAELAVVTPPVVVPPPIIEPPPPPPVELTDIEIHIDSNGNLLVRAPASFGKLKYVLVDNNAPNFTWLGAPVEEAAPFIIVPQYTKPGQRYKVLTLDNSKWKDGPLFVGTVPGTPAPPAGGTTSAGVALAKQFVAKQTIGLNIERLRPLTMNLGRTYYDYLKGLGLTHLRFFPGYRFDINMGWQGRPSVGSINGYLDKIQPAIDAGFQIYLDMMDVVGSGELRNNWTTVKGYLADFSECIKIRGWTPMQVAPGAFNELEGGSNPDFNDLRNEAHSIIRGVLPGHLILHGAAGWNGVQGWESGEWTKPADDQIICQIHYYGGPGAFNWSRAWEQFQQRSQDLGGVPFVLGELGDDFQHMSYGSDNTRWSQLFRDVASNGGLFRPMLWAMSGEGSDFRLNINSTNPRLQSTIESDIRACDSAIRKLPGWGV